MDEIDQALAQAEQALANAMRPVAPVASQPQSDPVEKILPVLACIVDEKVAQASSRSPLSIVTGPKGEKGDRGLPGRDGATGKNGKDGKDGKDGKPGKHIERRVGYADYERLKQPDGSAQVTFVQSGSGSGGSRSVQTELRELVFNIKSGPFGAAGDGTTDDKTAFLNAYNAANSAGGGIVFIPAGTFLFNSAAVLAGTNIIIMGPGTIKGASNVRPIEFTAATNNTIRGVKILGVQGSSSVRAPLMLIDGCTNVRVEECWFDDSSSSCIVIGSDNTRIRIVGNWMTDYYECGVDLVGDSNNDIVVEGNHMITAVVHPDGAISRPIGISTEPQNDGENTDLIYRNNVISFEGLSTTNMNTTNGISVQKHSSPATNYVHRRVVIEGNTIRGAGRGIAVTGLRYGTTSNAGTVMVRGNLLERIRLEALYLQGGESSAHRDTLLCASNIVKGFSESTSNTYDAIYVDQHWWNPLITGNHVGRREAESGAANGRYGVNIASTNVLLARVGPNEITGAQTAKYNDTSLQAILNEVDYTTDVALTADNQAVTVGLFRQIRLTSNDATAANRTFTLSPGQYPGQKLTLIFDDTDACQLADNGATVPAGGAVRLSANWEPTEDDSLSLEWDGDEWIELCRSAN
jgi:polygalacturonase